MGEERRAPYLPHPDRPAEWLHEANRRAELEERWRREELRAGRLGNPREFYRFAVERSDAAERWRANAERELSRADREITTRREWRDQIARIEQRRAPEIVAGVFPASPDLRRLQAAYRESGNLQAVLVPDIAGQLGPGWQQTYQRLLSATANFARRNELPRLLDLAHSSVVTVLADALRVQDPRLLAQDCWNQADTFYGASDLYRQINLLKARLEDWPTLLRSEYSPLPLLMADLADQIVAVSKSALAARTRLLRQISDPLSPWRHAHNALSIAGSGLEIITAARMVAEQLWARRGVSSYQKMASRLSEVIFDASPRAAQWRDEFLSNIKNLDTTWTDRIEEVRGSLRFVERNNNARWRQIWQPGRLDFVRHALENWCRAIPNNDIAAMDGSINTLAFDLRVVREMAAELQTAGYGASADLLKDVTDGLLQLLEQQIAFHVQRQS
jgi:hypothetical protein